MVTERFVLCVFVCVCVCAARFCFTLRWWDWEHSPNNLVLLLPLLSGWPADGCFSLSDRTDVLLCSISFSIIRLCITPFPKLTYFCLHSGQPFQKVLYFLSLSVFSQFELHWVNFSGSEFPLVYLQLHSDTALMPILFGEICVAQFLLYKPYRLSIQCVTPDLLPWCKGADYT